MINFVRSLFKGVGKFFSSLMYRVKTKYYYAYGYDDEGQPLHDATYPRDLWEREANREGIVTGMSSTSRLYGRMEYRKQQNQSDPTIPLIQKEIKRLEDESLDIQSRLFNIAEKRKEKVFFPTKNIGFRRIV